jgi:hypothetical protein
MYLLAKPNTKLYPDDQQYNQWNTRHTTLHVDVSGNEPIRITGLLFFGLQSLSGLALERKSEKNPEDGEKDGGCSDSVVAVSMPPCAACSSAAIILPVPEALPQGQAQIFLKHCLWKIDPHRPHFLASSSCNNDKHISSSMNKKTETKLQSKDLEEHLEWKYKGQGVITSLTSSARHTKIIAHKALFCDVHKYPV